MKNFKLLFLALTMLASYTLTAQVAITTDGSDPDGSAMLDVKSTDKGMLPPRMTEAQRDAIESPATGLMIYNTTTNSLDFFNTVKWISITETGIVAQNLPPVASNVSFSGTLEVGETLTGDYTYSDEEDDLEGTSTFKWYRADDISGTNQVEIGGANALTYQPVTADAEKYISFTVIPVAQTGETTGEAVISNYQGGVFACGISQITDIDENDYNTLQIGTQCWMKENLNVGVMIHSTTGGTNSDGKQTDNSTLEKYCYSNNTTNCNTYGGLYQWNEMMQYVNIEGAQGICPEGWHIPTDGEWTDLTTYVSNQAEYLCNDNTSYIAKALSVDLYWFNSSITCAVGNNITANNASGFTAMPSGYFQGSFNQINARSDMWSSTGTTTDAYGRTLAYNLDSPQKYTHSKSIGLSVRCLKDN
ncbi:MAG: fibrobacter succinogenes major paralogous domain-containing protein [Bacteroidales bacterium]|nr:fibrobacter succinogenes major paralogous domain-containing protein [Bacteroidales bacterium]